MTDGTAIEADSPREALIFLDGYQAGRQDGSEYEEAATLDHVHECYWLIPKPRAIRDRLYAWRHRPKQSA